MKNITCLEKQRELIQEFALCPTAEDKYKKIIEMGRDLPPYPNELKTPDKIVSGCQSTMYWHSSLENGHLIFSAHSDALISFGLSALLLYIYNYASIKDILTTPPHFIKEIQIPSLLSPSRSNGLIALYRRMQHDTLILSKKELSFS